MNCQKNNSHARFSSKICLEKLYLTNSNDLLWKQTYYFNNNEYFIKVRNSETILKHKKRYFLNIICRIDILDHYSAVL